MNGQTDPIPYRVLARKYRPVNFDELIGQELSLERVPAPEQSDPHHTRRCGRRRTAGKAPQARVEAALKIQLLVDRPGGDAVEHGFEYSSGGNPDRLTHEAFLKMAEEVDPV